jgi:hypothetical protein
MDSGRGEEVSRSGVIPGWRVKGRKAGRKNGETGRHADSTGYGGWEKMKRIKREESTEREDRTEGMEEGVVPFLLFLEKIGYCFIGSNLHLLVCVVHRRLMNSLLRRGGWGHLVFNLPL